MIGASQWLAALLFIGVAGGIGGGTSVGNRRAINVGWLCFTILLIGAALGAWG